MSSAIRFEMVRLWSFRAALLILTAHCASPESSELAETPLFKDPPREVPGTLSQSVLSGRCAELRKGIEGLVQCYGNASVPKCTSKEDADAQKAPILQALDELSGGLYGLLPTYAWNKTGNRPDITADRITGDFSKVVSAVEGVYGTKESADPCVYNRVIVPKLIQVICELYRKIWVAKQAAMTTSVMQSQLESIDFLLTQAGLGDCSAYRESL